MSGRRRRARATLALLAMLPLSPSAQATSASLSGIGPQSQALAGAGLTQDLGYETAFENPAALGEVKQPALSLGFAVTDTRLYLRREGAAEQRYPTELLHATELGFVLPLSIGEQRFVLGMASLSPGGFVARAELPLPEEPQFPLLVSRRQAVDFDLGLGSRPFEFLALGVGLRALSTLSGTAAVERGKNRTTTRVDDALEPVLAPLAGLTAFFGPARLGLVLRAPLRADFDVKLAAVDLETTQLPPLNLAGVAHYDPLTVQAEYAQRFGGLVALIGMTYERWQDTPPLLPRTVACPPERPDCLALTTSSPHFEDTFDLQAAVRYQLALTRDARAELRAGYAYVPSPVPEQTGSENLLDSARHRLGFGYGISLSQPLPDLSLDFAVQFERLPERTHHKRAEVPEDNAGAPTLTTRGSLLGASLGLTVRL